MSLFTTVTPLLQATFYEACSVGKLDKVDQYVKHQGCTPEMLRHGLIKSARNGQPAVTRYLLANGAKIDQVVTLNAAKGRCLEIFQALCEYGWDVNEPTLFGKNILTLVIDDEQLIRWLLGKGANPNHGAALFGSGLGKETDANSGEVLNAAAEGASVAVLNLLLERGTRLERSYPLHFAAKGRRIDIIQRLLELHVDINGFDELCGPYRIGTPLHYTARFRRAETVQYLLDNGADPNKAGQKSLLREAEPSVHVTRIIQKWITH